MTRDASDERSSQERTRDEVAKATERAKPAIERRRAGRLGKVAAQAADQAEAAAEGAPTRAGTAEKHIC